MKHVLGTLGSAAALMTVMCGAAPAATTVSYWMWDPLQAPVYRKCADKFEAAHPDIKIEIKLDGWSNYWTTLTTSFVSGTAPDVFVNHLTRFPEFATNGVMTDLTELIARDGVDLKAYKPGLAAAWSKDGHQWGLPKDWDTVAFFYNKKLVADAGVTEDELRNMTWNPGDGGTFERILARLTVDRNGKRGNQEGFDKNAVAVYGFANALNPSDGFGHIEWSYLSASMGFTYIDKPWGTHYNYDDPRLAATLTWVRDLRIGKGYAMPFDQAGTLSPIPLLQAGKAAMVPDGSWSIAWAKDSLPFEFGIAPVPKGPDGRRSMFNGIADSIWSGSQHQAEAWQWVKYLGSGECQAVVGESAVVFPSRSEATELAIATQKKRGLDISAFTLVATPETTFPFPITDYGNEISVTLKEAVNAVLLNQGDPATLLKAANDRVNGMF